jgi:hypothetical protein
MITSSAFSTRAQNSLGRGTHWDQHLGDGGVGVAVVAEGREDSVDLDGRVDVDGARWLVAEGRRATRVSKLPK